MTNRNGIAGVLISISEWIFKFMYVHVLWVLFTLLGLGIFGFMPATAAVFSVARKWLRNESDIAIFPHFFDVYKSSFAKSNIIGAVMLSIGAFLYIDIRISQQFLQFAPLHVFLLIIAFLYCVTCSYIFPVLAHYNLKPLQYIKQAFLHAVAQPVYTFTIILWLLCSYVLSVNIPVLYFFMGASVFTLPLMWFSLRSFDKLAKKKAVQPH